MPARTGRTTYVPGKGATTRGKSGAAKTFQGRGPAPSGTTKRPEATYLTAPTVTVSGGTVRTSGFSSPTAAQKAAKRTKRTQARVLRVVKKNAQKRSQPVKAPPKYVAPKTAYKPEGVSALPAIKVANRENAEDFAAEQKPVAVKAHMQKAPSMGSVPKVKPLTPAQQHPRAVKRVKARLAKASRAAPHVTGPLGPEQKKFVNRVAKRTHLSPRAIGAQAVAEEGNAAQTEAEGTHNFLNIGPGYSYPSLRSAVKETSKLINTGPSYQGIRESRGKGPRAQVQAIGSSPWGTDASLIQSTLSQVGLKGKPVPAKILKKAEALGIKTKAPDVSKGKGRMVKVRADAQGAVKWAEAQVGQHEGSPKTMAWGAKFGLNPVTQPWCANFVSNDLLRRGIRNLPSNPNYVPSYESEWAQYAVPGGLARAKKGDLLTFSGSHIGIYVGNGEMVSGNSSDAVSRGPAGEPSMVIRPPYKGGVIEVHEGTPLPGGTSPTALPSSSGTSVGAAGTTSESKAGKRRELTARQKYNRTKKKLHNLGVGESSTTTSQSDTTLKELEAKYLRAA